ncbi:elongation factor 4 [Patescibacteria group bacterium]|nr:elongation factor 4 [Patescibacteria group bacterium]
MTSLNIRNFCIISHIDHGKSTLADRLLEITGTVKKEQMKPQYLDKMALERERGITIKLQPVRMNYSLNNKQYILNLIDTPGHADFSYEVSRSLAAVEGAILLIDARQGIQAQTLANLYLAKKQNLVIIPVINKIDLSGVDLDKRKKELVDLLEIEEDDIVCISAKDGKNIEQVLAVLIDKVPSPVIDSVKSFQALIYDSFFDDYRGVIAFVRVFNGVVKKDDKIKLLGTKTKTIVTQTGFFSPDLVAKDNLFAGEIGYISTGLKDIEKCRVGDTICLDGDNVDALPGYEEPLSMVFAGIYPKNGDEFEKLKNALLKLKLNDSSLNFQPEGFSADGSSVLGKGFRVGFLGMLHLDIVQERLKREYGLDLVVTYPNIAYRVFSDNQAKEFKTIRSPLDFTNDSSITQVQEPWVVIKIIMPEESLGSVMNFITEFSMAQKSGNKFIEIKYIGSGISKQRQVILIYHIPFALLLADFYDKLKSVSQGYASYSYKIIGYLPTDVVKMDILIAGDVVKQLASIVYRDFSYIHGRKIVKKLKKLLPRQLFEVKIQAAINNRILASEKIPALRKNVTDKLYGGDVTRKKKLLAKQKKGKKRMMKTGKVNIPSDVYWKLMKG